MSQEATAISTVQAEKKLAERQRVIDSSAKAKISVIIIHDHPYPDSPLTTRKAATEHYLATQYGITEDVCVTMTEFSEKCLANEPIDGLFVLCENTANRDFDGDAFKTHFVLCESRFDSVDTGEPVHELLIFLSDKCYVITEKGPIDLRVYNADGAKELVGSSYRETV